MRVIFHVDVNNAFLSWTALDLLRQGSTVDIRKIPAVIGGDETKRHGIVVAKSPVAKKMGVVTAETLYSARKKCPNLKVFPANHELYHRMSNQLYEYFLTITPVVERFSVDECFLDMTGMEYLHKDLYAFALQMKEEIKQKFGYTVNIGIANNKLCAKMASDFEKPDKVHTLFQSEVASKMWPLPVEELFMVGKSTSKILHQLGIHTIHDLAIADPLLLKRYFKSFAITLKNYANGIDDSQVGKKEAKNKSISTTETLPTDVTDKKMLKEVLRYQADEIGHSLRKEGYYAKTVAIILRNSDFIDYSKQRKLVNPTNVTKVIYETICALLDQAWKKDPIRLIGIRVTDFTKENIKQISLFEDAIDDQQEQVQKTLDELQMKFGKEVIKPASFLKHDGKEQ